MDLETHKFCEVEKNLYLRMEIFSLRLVILTEKMMLMNVMDCIVQKISSVSDSWLGSDIWYGAILVSIFSNEVKFI